MDAMNELPDELARALAALDAQAARAAARVDPARTAAEVARRLREPASLTPWRPLWQLTLLRVAAALVLLVTGAVTARRLGWPFMRVAALPVAAQPELTAGQLADLLTLVDASRTDTLVPATLTTVTVDDLNEQELVSLLATLRPAD